VQAVLMLAETRQVPWNCLY